tara:strand:- start:718 stop:1227 length:510 start_codon:yes stop_codon:yes gene_type:complete
MFGLFGNKEKTPADYASFIGESICKVLTKQIDGIKERNGNLTRELIRDYIVDTRATMLVPTEKNDLNGENLIVFTYLDRIKPFQIFIDTSNLPNLYSMRIIGTDIYEGFDLVYFSEQSEYVRLSIKDFDIDMSIELIELLGTLAEMPHIYKCKPDQLFSNNLYAAKKES